LPEDREDGFADATQNNCGANDDFAPAVRRWRLECLWLPVALRCGSCLEAMLCAEFIATRESLANRIP
jgi:hypothetical protein